MALLVPYQPVLLACTRTLSVLSSAQVLAGNRMTQQNLLERFL